ncbi:serine/threonine protein kinase [Salmonella enterica subsp. enterica serovar Kentucky]|uniref:Serine/threonine protein kinase n=1 Tax=Salmonella enterica subsp. enterica serovar Kentucky TaxID=192955 RepID=A0A5X9KM59_SALET|nr:serine/threonine protein kinase [Salmonella enterica]EBF4411324.1 serine/threonine protein kinase [Salmonella enterica subsp. enterica serovar Kentucky]EGT6101116.1 serine/threonine protein kinase [Salmonella enterica subsp. enterica]EHL4931514.1 serine/threonine protein kinase [Escherichia coli]EBG3284606.1 serine/threonine protein kinase [Salmonella enterica subsp. enterica serovar Kentucky]
MESEIFSCLLRASAGFFLRFCLSWHYPNSPNSPKNSKPALSPHHDWLKTGSQRQNAPLRIWFYPQ